MKTTRFYSTLVLLALIGLFAFPLLAQDTNVIGSDTNAPAGPTVPGTETTVGIWANVQYAVPFLAAIAVFLMRKVPGWFETKLSARWLPYACVGVAFALMLILDLMGKLSIPLWIAGPLAGALGIGSRELLNNGLKLLGLVQPTPTNPPPTTPGS